MMTYYFPPTEEEIRLATERKRREAEHKATVQAERDAMFRKREAAMEAERERERQERVAPFKRFAETLARRLGPDLAQFADDFRRVDHKQVLAHLEDIVRQQREAERADEATMNREAMQREHVERHEQAAKQAEWRDLGLIS